MIHHCNNKYGDYHVAVIAGTTYVLTGTPGTQTFIVPANLNTLKTYTTSALTECLKQGAQLHTEGFTNHNKLRFSIMKLHEARKLTQQQTKELNEFSYRADSRPTFVS